MDGTNNSGANKYVFKCIRVNINTADANNNINKYTNMNTLILFILNEETDTFIYIYISRCLYLISVYIKI